MASVQSVCAAAFGEEVKNTANSFLYMELEYDGKKDTNVFFHRFWKDIEWPEPGLHIDLCSELETEKGFITTLKLRTEKYARMVSLDFDSMESCIFSDNYFDMIPGEERVIQVESDPAGPRRNRIGGFPRRKIQRRRFLCRSGRCKAGFIYL